MQTGRNALERGLLILQNFSYANSDFDRFKRRSYSHSIEVTREFASAHKKAAQEFIKTLVLF